MLVQNIPPILLVLFFGTLADRYGRKAIILLAFVGFTIWALIMTVVVAFDLNRMFIFAANFVWGCCGYYLSAVVAVLAYISDRTEPDNRAFRIGNMLLFFSYLS